MVTLVWLLTLLINAYILVLIVRAVLSWFPAASRNPVAQFLDRITEPVLAPIRSRLGMAGPVDFSPLVVILLLVLLRNLLVYLL